MWQRDLVSGKSNPLLPGLRILNYEISRDEKQVAFTVAGAGGERDIFVAASDRSTPPRLVVRGGDNVSFGAGGQLIFQQLSGKALYLARIQPDGSGLQRIQDVPIAQKSGVSPDGEWVLTGGAGTLVGAFAVSAQGKPHREICVTRCDAKWSPDGKYLYLTTGHPKRSNGLTYILPILPGAGIPDLPPFDETGPSGVRSIPRMAVAPGPDPDTYAFTKSEFKGNLFRIPLH